MSEQENSALVPHVPRALQREVERHISLMEAKAEISKKVVDCGTEIHDHAGKKVLASALLSDMLLKGAEQTLNGSFAAVDKDVRQMGENYRALIMKSVVQSMANTLRQAEEGMPLNPEVGLLARIGDGIAEIRDEMERTREGG